MGRCRDQYNALLPHELWDEMKIAYRAKKICQLTKLPIDVDLFDIRLMKPCRIFVILIIRPTKYLLFPFINDFAL